ncbi:hypothetical protein [Microbacterium sp. YY-01]|uniref:hypothetical protein n=1 Tax=Microbacterium sp. YY-01 TaxID=3421634 RepID=UPI003D1683CC
MHIRLRTRLVALTAGLVLIMTGCSSANSAPAADALYDAASARFHASFAVMHDVLMSVYEGTWQVDQGAYGADPSSCQIDGDTFGHFFNYVRTVQLDDADPDGIEVAALAAFERHGFSTEVTRFGEGEREERNVIAEDPIVGRAVVTVYPATGSIRVTARTDCLPGSAAELSTMIFGTDEHGSWRRVPATETPDAAPQFYFPPGGPEYYDRDGTPVDPQPVVSDPPVRPSQ